MFTQLISSGEFFIGTFWAFVPAIVAIVLALITKQVYLSLFAGIFVGAMFLADGNPLQAISNLFITMGNQLGKNGGILIFLVILGIFAVLMVKSGGSQAYGEWAASKIKTKKGAQLATIGLGCIIFVDDYFNCLTVGNAMRPVTDKHKISHSKLAYLIDSTAAPICIIAPISSWAAAVTGFLGSDSDGLVDFIKTIPFNMYALFTIAMMIIFVVLKLDIFKMKKNEKIAESSGDLYAGETDLPTEDISCDKSVKGKVMNLVFPIVTLIVCCVGAMVFNGYFYDWDAGIIGTTPQSSNPIKAFSNCDAGSSLAMGSAIALIITFVYYICTKTLKFSACMESIAEGFKSMVPAILILTFAWTLCALMGAKGAGMGHFCADGWENVSDSTFVGGFCETCGFSKEAISLGFDGSLNAKGFIQRVISPDSLSLGIVPALFFILACLISFSTGTSWGTFGTLIPISLSIAGNFNSAMIYLCMSAVLAGAVYGDHVSPISDTTIMASTGARCNHLDHVKTQFPYATLVALLCFIVYLSMGFVAASGLSYGATVGITFAVAAVLFAAFVFAVKVLDKKGILDKISAGFENLGKKLFKKPTDPKLSETIQGGSTVSDSIEEMRSKPSDKE